MPTKPAVTYRIKGKMRTAPHPARARWHDKNLDRIDIEGLPDDLARIVREFGHYYRRRPWEPSRGEIVETLRALKSETDVNIARALSKVDSATLCELWRVAHREAKEQGQRFRLSDYHAWTPDQVRAFAAAALETLPLSDGAPPKQHIHELFARRLIDYRVNQGLPVTVTAPNCYGFKGSEFLLWAVALFESAGAVIATQSLANILKRAKRK